MISCQQAMSQLWEYLDGTTDAETRALLEEHLSLCRWCCGELEFATEIRRMLRGTANEELPADVLFRLQQTLKELDP